MLLSRSLRFRSTLFLAFLAAWSALPISRFVTADDEKQVTKPVVKDGLSLMIGLSKKEYVVGDEIRLSFWLKNESDKELFISDGFLAPGYHEAGPERHFDVRATADGRKELYFGTGTATEGPTSAIRKVFKLKPGDIYTGEIALLRAVDNKNPVAEPGGSFAEKGSRTAHVPGKDGREYRIVLRYSAGGKAHPAWNPPADFSDSLLWIGELSSNPLTFVISPG